MYFNYKVNQQPNVIKLDIIAPEFENDQRHVAAKKLALICYHLNTRSRCNYQFFNGGVTSKSYDNDNCSYLRMSLGDQEELYSIDNDLEDKYFNLFNEPIYDEGIRNSAKRVTDWLQSLGRLNILIQQ